MYRFPISLLQIFVISVAFRLSRSISCSYKDPCDSSQSCPAGTFCTPLGSRNLCCGKTQCDDTKLDSFVENLDDLDGNKDWYESNFMINGIRTRLHCPLPRSYQLRHLLPVNFKPGVPITQCSSSSECGIDEFCGESFNPSYCSLDCRDRSGVDGSALKFCYKVPTLENKIHHVKKKQDFGISLCKSHADCVPTFCDTSGICIEARSCDPKNHRSIEGSLGINNDVCDVDHPKSCGDHGECVKSRNPMDQLSYCCYKIQDLKSKSGSCEQKCENCWISPTLISFLLCFVIISTCTAVMMYLFYQKMCFLTDKEKKIAKKHEVINKKIADFEKEKRDVAEKEKILLDKEKILMGRREEMDKKKQEKDNRKKKRQKKEEPKGTID